MMGFGSGILDPSDTYNGNGLWDEEQAEEQREKH